jgi:hypothetical protein
VRFTSATARKKIRNNTVKTNTKIQSTPRWLHAPAIASHDNNMTKPKPNRAGFPARIVCALLGAIALLLAAVPGRSATLTYDFNNATLQGWHNRVWDPALNAGAGAWFDLAPNVTDPYPTTLQPPSVDDNVFGNNGTQVDPIGGQNDNHLNTLWLRSPQFTLDGSGDLTAQMARGMAHGPAPANDTSVSYIADSSAGWKGVSLRRVSDGVFLLSKPRTSEGDTMVTVTFTAAELAPYVGVNCTLDLINAGRGGWGWLSMDNVSIPGTLVPATKLAVTSPSLVNGSSSTVTVSIPNNFNATIAVTVYVTNSNPSVLTINGSTAPVTTLTFAAAAASSQNLTVAGTGLGFARLTTGCASLLSDTTGLTVLPVSGLIGRWLSGSEDLADKSGYTPAGTHDGVLSDGLTVSFSTDVPPGAGGSSLDLATSGGAVLISNSVSSDPGYRATFDDGTAQQLSVVLWAKGLPDTWNPFISKYGEGSVGWQVRKRGGDPVATFTVRSTAGEDDPYNGSTLINDGAWHHFAATWDGVAGVRKLYVDGKLNIVVPHDAGPMGLATANYLTLGGRTGTGSSSPGNTFVGQLYDVQIYGVALSGSTVQSLFTRNTTAIVAYPYNPVIGLGQTGQVSISIPATANATTAVTVFVTNTTPAIVSLAGAVGNIATLTFPAGGATSQLLTLTGLSEGQAQLACAATGLTSASAAVSVYGQHLIGQWFNGTESFTNGSTFTPTGTHDGTEVGTIGNLTFTADTPPSKPGKAAQFGGGVGLMINNSSRFDAGYAPTFDDVIGQQFSVSFWAKGIPGTWNPFLSKRGEDAIGWEMRRSGGLTEAFTIRGTGSGNEDGVGSVPVNDGLWHHFAAVWDGHAGTRKCYVDGNLDPSINLTNDFAPMMMAPNHHFVLGGRESAAANGTPAFEGTFDNGLLYDVRMYNYPLSAAEVQTLSFVPALKVTPAQRSLPAPQTMTVDVILPAGANQSQAVTVQVTDNTPALASLVGAVGNVLTLNYAAGGSTTQQVTVAGIADGKAKLTATGGGFVAASGTFNVWADPGSRLIGHWLSGAADLVETSGFRPAGTHDGVAVGANAGYLQFTGDVPAVAPSGAFSLDLTAGNVAVMITNSSTVELGYVETFDNQMASKFSIAFWAKGTTPTTEDWNAWVSKDGESNGYQIRRNGTSSPVQPVFTIRGTPGADDPSAAAGVDDNWHHYAATWDGTTGIRTLYVDGNQVLLVSGDFGPFALSSNDHLMLGGLDTGSFRRFFPCSMYDVRVYSYALSSQEVGVIVNPPTAFTLAVTHETIPVGETVQLVVTLPTGATATAPVTVYLTNNSPTVVSIVGPTAITFPIGSLVQVVNLLTIGPGQINITAGAAGVGTAALTTVNLVVAPKLIGHWFNGAADLTDKSSYTPAGTHDGMVVGANPEALAYSADVPAGFSGQSLDLTANATAGVTVGVVVTNSAATDAGYQTTFDAGISSAFSVALWAKGLPSGWNGFASKRGEDGIGWQIRRGGGDTEAFTVRGTASGNYDGVGSVTIIDGQWHHFAGVWDGVTGIRKCYVDGVLDPSINLVGDFAPMSMAPNHHVGIGARESSTTGSFESWFNGKLYDVRIYNYAITPADVTALLSGAPKPTLKIQHWTGNQVRIAWPTSLTGYGIEQSSTVSGGWGPSGLSVTVEGSENAAYAPATGTPQFFRLKK